MSDCQVPGWGIGPWGFTPWGGGPPIVGGPLPTTQMFDIYCFGPCGPMSGILNHVEVTTVETGPQLTIDPSTLDLLMKSGGGLVSTDNALLTISTPVPEKYTLEWTGFFNALPADFNSLVSNHVYFGVSDAEGRVVGLFFSQGAIAYSGSVHLTGGDLVLDGPFQVLPTSAGIVSEGAYYTIRVGVNGESGVVYVYITRTSDLHRIGHQLRFILPALKSADMTIVPPDQTIISVRGTAPAPSMLGLDTICLGSGLQIPNILPIADAGIDQAKVRCSIAELDGSRSFDPEGAPLYYSWRLIDAPLTSQYLFHPLDGKTYPLVVPTGFTDRIYSEALGVLDAVDPLLAGDVLVVAGTVHVLESTGSDFSGFYVRVEGYLLPDDLTTGFKYLRQRGISGPTTVKPTFYPDVAGLYQFDLIVFDLSLFSKPSTTVLNVTESAVARGVTPDLRFVWNYLSDFWRLVEDGERIEAYWSGLAQVAASELLTLWQIDYSKSLRDIQRTAQRRWLHYDFLMQEGLPELSTLRVIYSGIESADIPSGGFSDVAGHHVDFTVPALMDPVVVNFSGAGNLAAIDMQVTLQAALYAVDARIKVTLLPSKSVSGMNRLRVDAPFAMEVAATTNAPLFLPGLNALPTGSGISIVARSYKVDRSLQGLGLREGDLLLLDGIGYRIGRLIDDPSDEWSWQRVTLLDEIPVPAPTTWSISGQVMSKTLDFDLGLVTPGDTATIEIVQKSTGTIGTLDVRVLGTSPSLPSTLSIDATSLGIYLSEPLVYSVFLKSVLRRTYLPLDPLIVDIPYLQEKIRPTDDTEVLRRNVDFFFEKRDGRNCLRFVTAASPGPDVWQYGAPPARMWAEVTYLDNRSTIEANFGIPAGFTLDDLATFPSNVDYLSSVRGLWYAYFNGPTLFNLKAGTQILLGLPFAEEAGVIEEIRTDFSASQGRILVRDLASTAIVRSYAYPSSLVVEKNPATKELYKVGDEVAQFAPLVTGIEVVDWIKDPRWFGGYLGQGAFFEVEKFFKFLVRVDSTAFNLAALLFAQTFIRRIKPTYTFPLFVVLMKLGDTEITTTDAIALTGRLLLNDLGVSNRSFGMSTMIDEGDPSGGGWQSQLDTDSDPSTDPPTSPTSDLMLFGIDKNYLAPEDAIAAFFTMTFPHNQPPGYTSGPLDSHPVLDGPFRVGVPLYEVGDDGIPTPIYFQDYHVHGVPKGPDGYVMELDDQVVAGAAGTLTHCQLDITGDPGDPADSPPNYVLVIEKNGSAVVTQAFTVTGDGIALGLTVSLAVIVGDHLRARIKPATAVDTRPTWQHVLVQLYVGVPWDVATPLPDGRYGCLRAM
jgi:hypothetical protein